MNNEEFKKLAYEKSQIAHSFNQGCPHNWCWIIIDESKTEITVTFRKVEQ